MQNITRNKKLIFAATALLFFACVSLRVIPCHAQKNKAEVSIKSAEDKTPQKPPDAGYDGSTDVSVKDDKENSAKDDSGLFGSYQDPAPTTLPNPVYAFIRSIGSLVFILALVYLSIYGLKVFMNKKPGFAFSSNIHVLESVFLSSNKSLHLVEIGGEVLLLGVTEGNMSVLKEISDPQSLKSLRAKMTPAGAGNARTTSSPSSMKTAAAPSSSFKETLQKAAAGFQNAGKNTDEKASPQNAAPAADDTIRNSLNILRKELEKIQEIRKKEIS